MFIIKSIRRKDITMVGTSGTVGGHNIACRVGRSTGFPYLHQVLDPIFKDTTALLAAKRLSSS